MRVRVEGKSKGEGEGEGEGEGKGVREGKRQRLTSPTAVWGSRT